MTFITIESKTVKLKQGDAEFNIIDNLSVVPRASIEIQASCPASYVQLITYAITRGWIKPIAHIKKTEHIFNVLERSE